MTHAGSTIGLSMEPLDTLFFRDGRPFDPATRRRSGLPTPQTLAGAVRTRLLQSNGFDLAQLGAELRRSRPATAVREALAKAGAPDWILRTTFRGPWLALQRPRASVEPLLAVPWTLARSEPDGRWYRARPRSGVPGWRAPEGFSNLLPLWRTEGAFAKHPRGYLTPRGIAAFLASAGGVPQDVDWFRESELFGDDARTGISIDPDALTAIEGLIYGVTLLALRKQVQDRGQLGAVDPYRGAGVSLYAEVLFPPEAPPNAEQHLTGLMPLGGEGRFVENRVCPAHTWPNGTATDSLLLLATPGLFRVDNRPAWAPDGVPIEQLRAAACGAGVAVSGWDVIRGGPRPTRFAVPAGSVYYLQGDFPPGRSSLCADSEDAAEDAAQGWGFALRGAGHD